MAGSKTLLLTSDFPPLGGGIARLCAEVAARRSHWVVSTPVPTQGWGREREPAVAIERLGIGVRRARSLPGIALWVRQAARLQRRESVDLVYSANLKPAGYVAYALLALRGIPYLVAAYGRDLLTARRQASHSGLKRRWLRTLLQSARLVVVSSDWAAGQARELMVELGLPGDEPRVRTVRPGVDVERFRPGLEVSAVRSRYGIPPGPVLLTVARLEQHKGIGTVLKALQGLKDLGVTYLVAGEGSAAGELRRLAASLGVERQVCWLGLVPEDDLPSIYNLADWYVGMSEQIGLEVEGFGISFLEAAACGVPALAARSGGIPEAVLDGETGYLLEPGASDELARAVRALLSKPDHRTRLGKAARLRVGRDFSWSRVCGELDRVEEEVRRSPRGRGRGSSLNVS